jgi:7-cyano-7-deazaguanine synthase
MKSQKICVLISGGMDSSVLLWWMAGRYREVYPVYIQCGLSWEKTELYWLKKFLKATQLKNVKPLKILKTSVKEIYKTHWSLTGQHVPGFKSADQEVYLPGRNLVLLSFAAVECSLRRIPVMALGVLKANPFPDSQEKFFRVFEHLFKLGLKAPIKILTPFSKFSKKQVLQKARAIPLKYTFSCLNPKGIQPCGQCNKCAEREKVMRAM